MQIIITTFQREKQLKILKQLPPSLYKFTTFFTRLDRYDILREIVPKKIRVCANPMDIDGIADIRQRCINRISKGKVWIIDDQVNFVDRDKSEFTDKDFVTLYKLIKKRLNYYAQVGISPRVFNNIQLNDDHEIGRAYSTYGLRTDIMQQLGIRFDGMYQLNKEVKYYEDFYITLSFLSMGFKNLIIDKYYFIYSHGIKGGNSTERTLKRQDLSAKALAKRFPNLVKLTKKKGGWKNGMGDRTEVKIQWKKAFRPIEK